MTALWPRAIDRQHEQRYGLLSLKFGGVLSHQAGVQLGAKLLAVDTTLL
jgi:hypothetical protein